MKKLPLSIFVSAFLMVTHSHGDVVLQDFYSAGIAGDAPTDLGGGVFGYEINLDPDTEFSAAGHGKMVLVYSGHDGNVAGVPTVTKVTYNGVPLTEAIQDTDNLELLTAGIFYLDNVDSDGTLRIELVSNTTVHYGFGLYAIDGLKPGVQDTGTALEPLSEASVTMSTDSGFFVQESARNNQSLGDDPEDDFLTLYNYNVDSYRGLSQYQVTSVAGDYLAPIGNTGVNFRRVVAAAFEGVPGPVIRPKITSITSLGANVFELTLTGEPETGYEFHSSTTLEFNPGTLVENLTQGDPGDAGTIGGANNRVLTTDAGGEAKVRIILTGTPRDFVRAQTVAPLLSEDFEAGAGGFTAENKASGTNWTHGEPNSPSQGGGAVIGGNGGSTSAWGTNLTGGYAADTNACLRSGVIDLGGVSAAELSFALAIDSSAGHTYQVDVIGDSTDTVIASVIAATADADTTESPWQTIGPIAVPAAALNQKVRIQWTFIGGGDGTFNGAYIDDVLVEMAAP